MIQHNLTMQPSTLPYVIFKMPFGALLSYINCILLPFSLPISVPIMNNYKYLKIHYIFITNTRLCAELGGVAEAVCCCTTNFGAAVTEKLT